MIDVTKYIVLDVETNGKSASNYDLLSISIYDPESKESYDRFLPLELDDFVYTTEINGITDEMLEDKKPISQSEFDDLIKRFHLDSRIILTYGSIDEKFIKSYCFRHRLNGFDKLTFHNFKHQIIASGFSSGTITKDNLCKIYGIDNVQKVHSGHNDCILEWKLFEKINNNFLLVTGNRVYELNNNYIIPVSYLQSYSNFKYYKKIPDIYVQTKIVKSFELNTRKITRYETNINGISIEHLINTMLNVEKIDSFKFDLKNKSNLSFIGTLPSVVHEIPVFLSNDGTIKSLRKQDDEYIESVNKTTEQIKQQIQPLIEFIKTKIFKGEKIYSQELIIDEKEKISAKCDLSNENAVLEIKTGYDLNFEKIKLQLYYEAKNRPIYVLNFDWDKSEFVITQVEFINEFSFYENKRRDKILNSTKDFQKKILNKDIVVLEYVNSSCPVRLKCKVCNREWNSNYKKILDNPVCPYCFPKKVVTAVEKKLMVTEKKDYGKEFSKKVFEKSNGTIVVFKYYGAKSNAEVGCLKCDNIWKIRADHLLERCYCPKCKFTNDIN